MDPVELVFSKLLKGIVDFKAPSFYQSKSAAEKTDAAASLLEEITAALRDELVGGTPTIQIVERADYRVFFAIADGLVEILRSRPYFPGAAEAALRARISEGVLTLAQVEHLLWTIALAESGDADLDARGQMETRWRQALFHIGDIAGKLPDAAIEVPESLVDAVAPEPAQQKEVDDARNTAIRLLTRLVGLGSSIKEAVRAAVIYRPPKD